MRIDDFLTNSVNKCPNRLAVREGERSYSYQELDEAACRAANVLAVLGVAPQDFVTIIGPNSLSYVELMFANAKAGAVSEQVNWRFAPTVICELLQESESKVVFISGACQDTYRYLKQHLARPVTFVSLDSPIEGELQYEALRDQQSTTFESPPVREDDLAMLLYTSGSTGKPKGVLYTVGGVVLKVLLMVLETSWVAGEVYICVLSLHHSACLTLYETVAVGGSYIFGGTKVEDIAAAIARERATRVSLVPSLIKQLLLYVVESSVDLSSLRVIDYGGSSMSASLIADCKKHLSCDFCQGYGMTETLTTLTSLTPAMHANPDKVKSVGRPMLGTAIAIVDAAGGRLPVDETGEIVARTPAVMKGYYKNAQATAAVLRDGWYFTGDIGYLDADGFLYIRGRKNGMIISGGENIFPDEVAECIRGMGADILDVAVTGVPDEVYDETVMAVVVKAPGSSIEARDVIEHCRHNLASYKKPRYVHFVASIPRNAMGKVVRAGLLDIHNERLRQM